MAAILYWVRADLRHRRWAAIGLVVLVAVAAVVPLTAAAAARRTASSLDRMRAELEPYHADVQFEAGEPPVGARERIAALPGVETVGEGASLLARPVGTDLEFFESFGQGGIDASLGREFERARIDEGRLPAAADETLVSTRLATRLGLAIGDQIRIETLTPGGLEAVFAGEVVEYDGPALPLTVVGIGRQPEEITGGGEGGVVPLFVLASEFFTEWQGGVAFWDGIFLTRLTDGIAAGDEFRAAVRAEFSDRADVAVHVSNEQSRADDAVAAQSLGLALLAAASGIAALVAVGQAVRRFTREQTDGRPIASALGFGRRERALARGLTAVVPVAVGVLVAIGGAIAASSWFPAGPAARIEPAPGIDIDVLVLASGALTALVLAGAVAAPGPRRPWPTRPSRLGQWMVGSNLPPAVATGLRSALHAGSGRRSVPVRSAFVAGIAGVAGVLAALVFGASLDRLTETPTRFGFNWDLSVGIGDDLDDDDAFEKAQQIEGDERIDAATMVRVDNIVIEGREEFVFAFRHVVDGVDFTVVDGHAARAAGEVALGGRTLDDLGVSVGETVLAEGVDGDPIPLTVVGQALFPTVENDDAARGAAVTLETYEQLSSPGSGFPNLHVRLVEDADPAEVAADLEQKIGFVNGVVAPPAVSNLRGVDEIPYALGAFLGVLGLLAVAHALLTALRRRRQELAVLKTLGFVRRQMAVTVVVQSLVFGIVGLLIGLPIGLAVGSQTWGALSGRLGFATDAFLPSWVILIVPAVAAVLLLVAALPARSAARIPAADLLRSE